VEQIMSGQGFLKRQEEKRLKAIADRKGRECAARDQVVQQYMYRGWLAANGIPIDSTSKAEDSHWWQRSRWKFFERLNAGLYQ
jgi:hypothetical protein